MPRNAITSARLFLLEHLACPRVNVAVCALLYPSSPRGKSHPSAAPVSLAPGRLLRLTVAGRGRIIRGGRKWHDTIVQRVGNNNRSPAIICTSSPHGARRYASI
jgi:hypothetical protein